MQEIYEFRSIKGLLGKANDFCKEDVVLGKFLNLLLQ